VKHSARQKIAWYSPIQANDFLAGMGLGAIGDQLKDLRLSELLDTLPPGVDEAVAISKVGRFWEAV